MKASIKKQCVKHAGAIRAIFPFCIDLDDLALCRALRKMEMEATQASTKYANGEIDGETLITVFSNVKTRLFALLNPTDVNMADEIFLNSDPRGYALKLRSEFTVHFHTIADKDEKSRYYGHRITRDWGGFGILAPEFT